MRIFIAPGSGGIARVARLMARLLAEEAAAGRLSVRGVTLGDAEAPADIPFPVVLGRGAKFRFALAALKASRHFSSYIHDGCQVAQAHALPLLRRKPFLTFMHGIEVWEQAKPGYIKSARRAAMLLANSAFTLAKAQHVHGGFERARVCWLATEADELPAKVGREQSAVGGGRGERPEVLIVGRVDSEQYKGHRELIAWWPRVVAAVPGAVLRIVGTGIDLQALRRLAGESAANGQIVFDGFVPDAELETLYGRASVFAMPSRGEGFGLVYIEAMRHGLPVIASVHDAAPEIVLDAQTGYTVNLDREGELAERIIQLLQNPRQARQMGLAGQRRWGEHFRYSAFRERFRPLLWEFLQTSAMPRISGA